MFDKTREILSFVSTFVRLVRDPGRLDLVFSVGDSPRSRQRLAEGPPLLTQPSVAPHLTTCRPPSLDLRALRLLPASTLGGAYARFMDERGLDPDDLVLRSGHDDLERFRNHVRGSHDLWHVMTGFDTDVTGELGVQAFYISQLNIPVGGILIAAGLLNAVLLNPWTLERRMAAVARGWWLGKQARSLFGLDWDDLLTRDVDQLRQELGLIQPVPAGLELPLAA